VASFAPGTMGAEERSKQPAKLDIFRCNDNFALRTSLSDIQCTQRWSVHRIPVTVMTQIQVNHQLHR